MRRPTSGAGGDRVFTSKLFTGPPRAHVGAAGEAHVHVMRAAPQPGGPNGQQSAASREPAASDTAASPASSSRSGSALTPLRDEVATALAALELLNQKNAALERVVHGLQTEQDLMMRKWQRARAAGAQQFDAKSASARLLVIGGKSEVDILQSAECYADGAWCRAPALSAPTYGACATSIDDAVVVIGGSDGGRPRPDVHRLRSSAAGWEVPPSPLPPPVPTHGAPIPAVRTCPLDPIRATHARTADSRRRRCLPSCSRADSRARWRAEAPSTSSAA